MRRALGLVAITLAACVPEPHGPAPPPQPRSAFGCTAVRTTPPEAPDPTPPRLDITPRSPLHFEIRAEAATAAQLAAGLGQAIGEAFVLADGLTDRRFTFYFPDATISDVDTLLAARTGVRILKRDNMFVIEPPGGGTRWAPDLAPIQSSVVTPHGSQTPEQVAALYCRVFASPVGGAQVIGNEVLVFDRGANAQRFIQALPKITP